MAAVHSLDLMSERRESSCHVTFLHFDGLLPKIVSMQLDVLDIAIDLQGLKGECIHEVNRCRLTVG